MAAAATAPPALPVGALVCPVLFVLACWYAANEPAKVAQALPDPGVWFLLGTAPKLAANGPRELVPPSVAAAHALGRIATAIKSTAPSSAEELTLIHEAAALLPRASAALMTRANVLNDVQAAAEAVSNTTGIAAKVLGVFNVVNIAATLALVGICVSIGPTLAIFAKPLVDVLKAVARELAPYVRDLVKLAFRCREPIAYSVVFYVIGAAGRFDDDAAKQVALLGCCLAPLALNQTRTAHFSGGFTTGDHDRQLLKLQSVWAAAYLSPIASLHQSVFIGTLAVAAFYAALGFLVAPVLFGWVVGFDSKESMRQSQLASVLLLCGFFWSRASGVNPEALRPFQNGVAIFGTVALGLSGLIQSSHWVTWAKSEYFRINAAYLGVLVVVGGAGAFYAIPLATNTALTFFTLWLGEKLAESVKPGSAWFFPAVFFGSVALWNATLYLRANPAFVYSLFSLDV